MAAAPAPDPNDPCRSQRGCASDGRCTTAPDGCLAAFDADCKASAACRIEGRCKVADGKCGR